MRKYIFTFCETILYDPPVRQMLQIIVTYSWYGVKAQAYKKHTFPFPMSQVQLKFQCLSWKTKPLQILSQ